jgi:urease accessory protein
MRTDIDSGRPKSMLSAEGLLGLLHISSPALPVGAFAYSQGLEHAIDQKWCQNRDEIYSWINHGLNFGLGSLDLPIYIRIYEAWKDKNFELVNDWNEMLLAYRETQELYQEDLQVGRAFAQWHLGLGKPNARDEYLNACKQPTVVAMASLASALNQTPLDHALLGFAWAWCENQVTCASKILPMGQTDAQRILLKIIPEIVNVCKKAEAIDDDELGSGLTAMAMASSWHEHQYSRLFRS